ncbi:hypothetical protein BDZ91DRAFT_773075 [Kalaharituber pfeilii]|nr:hypothetical protein BDZ91DRAFT_773075 [Kalaharituber pfeilii]
MSTPRAQADELKAQGNACYQAGDYLGAEKYYTQAIIRDPTNHAYFTNRALARLKLSLWEAVISDCQHALELLPTSLKAYTYLGQAQLKLDRPNEALSSSQQAYKLAIVQRSPSASTIAGTVLAAKKRKWEVAEERRIMEENGLLRRLVGLLEEEGEREAQARIAALKTVFARSDPSNKPRIVPDYLIDNITFSIMHDPVMTKHGQSYERATILEHLRRSKTDPLTREPLEEADLRPNLALRQACEDFLKENGWAVDY